jgi:hypothetical protein
LSLISTRGAEGANQSAGLSLDFAEEGAKESIDAEDLKPRPPDRPENSTSVFENISLDVFGTRGVGRLENNDVLYAVVTTTDRRRKIPTKASGLLNIAHQ